MTGPAEVARRGAGYLERHGVESPASTAEALLMSVLGTDRAGLYGRRRDLTPEESKVYGRALCSRCSGVPTQHLTGTQGFRHLLLTVRPGVFVPRPETEVLVDAALRVLRERGRPLVADVGTGSGAIALSLKQESPAATVWGTDISAEAVALATENARREGLDVSIVLGDLLDPLPAGIRGRLDLVVSNPPYVDPSNEPSLPPEVRADPRAATIGGPEVYVRLFAAASEWLRPGGGVAVEIDERRGADVVAQARAAGFQDATVLPDLTGRDRVAVARAP
jgi:release factor glutamine methyltransferase